MKVAATSEVARINRLCVWQFIQLNCYGRAKQEVTTIANTSDPFKSWKALDKFYNSPSEARINAALVKWSELSMSRGETGTMYVARIRLLVDELERVKHPKDSREIMMKLRITLDQSRYSSVIGILCLSPDGSEVEKIYDMIRLIDDDNEMRRRFSPSEETSMALSMVLDTSENSNGRGRGVNAIGRGNRGRHYTRSISCHHCGRPGHMSFQCNDRNNPQTEEGRRIEEETRARIQQRDYQRGRGANRGGNSARGGGNGGGGETAVGQQANQSTSNSSSSSTSSSSSSSNSSSTVGGNRTANSIVLVPKQTKNEIVAYVDSAASGGCMPNTDMIQNIQEEDDPRPFETAKGDNIAPKLKGDLKVFEDRDESVKVSITDEFKHPLLSVSSVCKENKVSMIFDDRGLCIVDGYINLGESEILGRGTLSNSVYLYRIGGRKEEDECLLYDVGVSKAFPSVRNNCKKVYVMRDWVLEEKYGIWHRRFAHLAAMERTIKLGAALNIPESVEDLVFEQCMCVACVAAKQKRQSFRSPEREHVEGEVGEDVHFDAWKIKDKDKPSIGGCTTIHRMIVGKADFARSFPVKSRVEAAEITIQFIKWLERTTGRKCRRVYCDNAPEYVGPNCDLVKELLAMGIEILPSVRYTPEMNSTVERAHHLIQSNAEAVRLEAELPERFWEEATRFVTIVSNACVKKGRTKSPFEEVYGRKFDFSLIRIFGCHAYVHIPKELRERKIGPRSIACIYLGPSTSFRAYRLYNVETGEIFDAHSVIFDEKSFGLQTLKERIKNARDEILGKEGQKEEDMEALEASDEESTSRSSSEEHNSNEISEVLFKDNIEPCTDTAEERGNDVMSTISRKSTRIRKSNESDDFEWEYSKRWAKAAVKLQNDVNGHLTPKSFRQAMASSDKDEWEKAMKREINALMSVGTYELVERQPSMKVMRGVWSYRIKTKNGEITQYKARYCADGSQEDIEKELKFSPVINIVTIRLVVALAAMHGLELHNGDIPSAYVRAYINEGDEYYLEQPKGFDDGSGRVWKLKRPLYGMKTSGRLWNETVTSFLLSVNFNQSDVDPCLFIRREGDDFMIIVLAVDDFLVCATNNKLKNDVMLALKEKFDYQDLGLCSCYLGVKFTQSYDKIRMVQDDYAKTIIEMFPKVNKRETPADTNEKLTDTGSEDVDATMFRSICGKLRYLTATRMDIEYALNRCSRFQKNPKKQHLEALMKIIGYLKKYPDLGITYCIDGSSNMEMVISAYSDSSHLDDMDTRRSTIGRICLLSGLPVLWKSNLTNTVMTSVAHGEVVAMDECMKDMTFVSNLLKSLDFNVQLPMDVYTDNDTARGTVTTQRLTEKSRIIDGRIKRMREMCKFGLVKVNRVDTKDNLSDQLTKPLGPKKLHENVEKVMNGVNIFKREKREGGVCEMHDEVVHEET